MNESDTPEEGSPWLVEDFIIFGENGRAARVRTENGKTVWIDLEDDEDGE